MTVGAHPPHERQLVPALCAPTFLCAAIMPLSWCVLITIFAVQVSSRPRAQNRDCVGTSSFDPTSECGLVAPHPPSPKVGRKFEIGPFGDQQGLLFARPNSPPCQKQDPPPDLKVWTKHLHHGPQMYLALRNPRSQSAHVSEEEDGSRDN